jgi:organic radical activating enzyme
MSLRKPSRETDRQVLDYLNSISPSMCLAKWYNATIWLGSGMTTSCHHPPAHKIDEKAIKIYPAAIHNTPQKKQDRAMMQKGEYPTGCEYCWKIESMNRQNISDRLYKSIIYDEKALSEAQHLDPEVDVNLRTLEISFDRTCQFACSYCNPAFSSSWVRDIHANGPYVGLVSDGRNHFTHTHDSAQLYTVNESNPYVEAFFQWWESDLHRTLDELRITGGEPLMSGYTWRLIDWFVANQGRSRTRLAINSNLGMEPTRIENLLARLESIPKVDIYTSNESMNGQAEYIRDGLDFAQWLSNVNLLLSSDRVRAVHSMCTINALCLDSLPSYLSLLLGLKQRWGRNRINFTLNILRFPSFQSALVLPDDIRDYYRARLSEWLQVNHDHPLLHEHEINHLQRLIDYLDVVKTPHSDTFEMPKLHNDFRRFYDQYDQRRGKNFSATFPRLEAWYDSISVQ